MSLWNRVPKSYLLNLFFGAFLVAGSVFFLCATKNLHVGLRFIPNRTGAVTCYWLDSAGQKTFLRTESTRTGNAEFSIPKQARSFAFELAPTEDNYQFEGLSLFGISFPDVELLLDNKCITKPKIDDYFLTPEHTIRVPAHRSTTLELQSLAPRLLRIFLIGRIAGTLFINALAILILIWPLFRTSVAISAKQTITRFLDRLSRNRQFLVCTIIGTGFLSLPQPAIPISTGLDPSWQWLFNVLTEHPDWIGQQLVFTYGPLGFVLYTQAHLPNVLTALIFNLSLAVVWSSVLLYLVRTRGDSAQAVWCLVAFTVVGQIPREWQWSLLVVMLFTISCLQPNMRPSTLATFAWLGGTIAGCAILMKFTILIIVFASLLSTLVYMAVFQNKRLFVFSASFLIGIGSSFALGLFLLFPSFEAMRAWAWGSMEIANGYNMAMVRSVSWAEVIVPIGYVTSVSVFMFLFCGFASNQFLRLILVLPALGFAYKYSVTRGGFGYIIVLLWVATFLTALLSVFSSKERRTSFYRMFLTQCAIGLVITAPVLVLVYGDLPGSISLRNLRNTLCLRACVDYNKQLSNENLRSRRLPDDWLRVIGTNTFQPFPNDLSTVPANGLTIVPFYTSQAYSAYTHALDTRSARLYDSESAPKTLLCEFDSVDRRNPILDCPAVWNAIQRNYTLALYDDNRILLKKRMPKQNDALTEISRMTVHSGEWIDLDAQKNQYMSVNWDLTFLGRLGAVAIHNTIPFVVVEYSNGQQIFCRLVPDTLKTPFEPRFIPRNFYDMLEWFKDPSALAARPLRIKFDCERHFYYSPVIDIRFFSNTAH